MEYLDLKECFFFVGRTSGHLAILGRPHFNKHVILPFPWCLSFGCGSLSIKEIIKVAAGVAAFQQINYILHHMVRARVSFARAKKAHNLIVVTNKLSTNRFICE
jgi:hypothetical protein